MCVTPSQNVLEQHSKSEFLPGQLHIAVCAVGSCFVKWGPTVYPSAVRSEVRVSIPGAGIHYYAQGHVNRLDAKNKGSSFRG